MKVTRPVHARRALPFVAIGLLLHCAALSHAQPAGGPYGIGTHFNEVETYELIQEAGIQWIRLDVSWYHVEPEQDEWDFSQVDAALDRAEQLGLRTLAILSYSTDWNTTGEPDDDRRHKYAHGQDYDPHYQQYIKKVVSRYQDVVDAWELHNEVDHYGHFRVGPGAWAHNHFPEANHDELRRRQYVHMVDLAMSVLEPMDVKLTTSGFAMGGSHDEGFVDWLAEQPGFFEQFDVFNCHAYGWPGHNSVSNRIATVKAIQQDLGLDAQPIWMTEHGINRPLDEMESPEIAKGYLIRSYAIALREGAEKVFWFRHAPGWGGHVSMLDNRLQPTMIFDAHQLLTAQWPNPVAFREVHWDDLSGTIATQADGSRVAVVWAESNEVPIQRLEGRGTQAIDVNGSPIDLAGDAVINKDPIFLHLKE